MVSGAQNGCIASCPKQERSSPTVYASTHAHTVLSGPGGKTKNLHAVHARPLRCQDSMQCVLKTHPWLYLS